MAQIYNEQRVLGIRIVADGTAMYLGSPVVGVRDVSASLFTSNLRTIGVATLNADQTIYNDQQTVGAVLISDARTLYNNQPVLPAYAITGLAIVPAPTMALDFLSASLDPRITASGGANGTRINSAGVIVAATAPRFDYDPATLAPRGVLVEEARTNMLLNALINGANLTTQSVTVAAVEHTLSFYGTGTITLSGASSGAVVGTGAYPSRRTITFTSTAGTLTLTVTGTVQFAQLEVGAFATSFIPTAGAAVTRSLDTLVMSGANFSSWHNAAAGTFAAKADGPAIGGGPFYVITATDADDTDNERILFQSGSGNVVATLITGGVNQGPMTIGTRTANIPATAALAYALNDMAASFNGGAVVTDATVDLPVGSDRLCIGNSALLSVPLNGHVQSIRYWNTRLTNAQLIALSTG